MSTVESVQDRTLTPAVKNMVRELVHRFGRKRNDLLSDRAVRRAMLSAGTIDFREETAHVRRSDWTIDPLPDALLERRVELIGGAHRSELINGLNAGAKTYIADLWNFTPNDTWNILRAHRSLERASKLELAYLDTLEGRVRVNPNTATRLMVVPRPLYAVEGALLLDDEPVPAAFFDLAMIVHNCAASWTAKQGGVYFYLRDVHGHLEARMWEQVFDTLEELADLPRGTIRATVMIDSITAALEADEILFELMHHAAGLSVDPQGYAADHVALFHGADRPVLPDRETIVLNAPMLRALSLRIIGVCHRRGCHAIGAPSFVLPPLVRERIKASYLEMLGDKEREATDGFDGTIVVDGDTVNPAMVEFNKSMPRANQLYYLRNDDIRPSDLIQRPEGAITVESLVGMIRTTLRYMVQRDEGRGWVIQGGRKHDRSSLRLALRLLWQWNHSTAGVITATGLEVRDHLIRFLVRKESEKMFADSDDLTRKLAATAVDRILELVLAPEVPMEPMN
jgi:malate synthase